MQRQLGNGLPGLKNEPLKMRNAMLLRAGVIAVSVSALVFNPYDRPQLHLWLGITILVIALWPLDRWLRPSTQRSIPAFELHLTFYAACFGFAAFVGSPHGLDLMLRINDRSYTVGLLAVILGLVSLYLGYWLSRYARGNLLALLTPRFPTGADKLAIVYLYPCLFILSLFVDHFELSSLNQILPVLRVFAFVWALCAAWSGSVPRLLAMVVMWIILPLELLVFNGLLGGALAGLLRWGEMIIVCYAVCRGKVLVSVALVAIAAFAVLQPIKSGYREVISNQTGALSTSQQVDILMDAAFGHIRSAVNSGTIGDSLQDSYGRLNQLSVSSAVIASTQQDDSYLHGRTLLPILTKWIPRALWPDKPAEDLGNSWAHRYGFIGTRDFNTSFNLPWLPEMYMNFGWLGVGFVSLAIGLLIGWFKHGIVVRARKPVEIAFAFSLVSAFFWPESNMSLGLGGIIITWISVALLLVGIRAVHRVGLRHSRMSPT